MKTIKKTFFNNKLSVVVKPTEVKGNPDEISVKVYISDDKGNKKIYFPLEIIKNVVGNKLNTNELREEFFKKWRINFFVKDSKEELGLCHFQYSRCGGISNGRMTTKDYYCQDGYAHYYDVPLIEWRGVRVDRDYFNLFLSKEDFDKGISLCLIDSESGDKKTIFDIDMGSVTVSGQRKANISGLNEYVLDYLKITNGLCGIPSMTDTNEISEWYNSLRQVEADRYRRNSEVFYSMHGDATPKQKSFIEKNVDSEIIKRFGGVDNMSKAIASVIITDFCDKNQK